jgi:hypothetical protein
MEETIGKASLRDPSIGTGIAVDKMLALTGQAPSIQVNIANLQPPTPEEQARRKADDDALDAFTRKIWGQSPNGPQRELEDFYRHKPRLEG